MRGHTLVRWGALLVSSLVAAGALAAPAAGGGTSPAASGPAASERAAARAPERVGAGQNAPRYTDGYARWWYRCLDSGNFKVTDARIVMWSKGRNRVKGFQFKYRLVHNGTAGQPQWFSNWSANRSVSFRQGTVQSRWLSAGALGQSFGAAADWDIEIKLKYPRSLRPAYRFKYRRALPEPPCFTASPRQRVGTLQAR